MNNLAIVQQFYSALAQKDTAAARAFLAPDIEWNQAEGWPEGSRHVGPEAVLREVLDKNHEEWADWQFNVNQWIEAGDTIVALGEYRGTNRDTGRAMRAAFAHVYDLQDGKIIRFRQYADTARLRDALAPTFPGPADIKAGD